MLDANVVGSVLQRLREERGLSQEIVSGLAGIGRTHLSAIERGERKPTLETFYRIGEALHMRPRRKKQESSRSPVFCFSFAPSGITVPRGNTAGRGLRGADSRAWSARS